jgi:hypothetical protein
MPAAAFASCRHVVVHTFHGNGPRAAIAPLPHTAVFRVVLLMSCRREMPRSRRINGSAGAVEWAI